MTSIDNEPSSLSKKIITDILYNDYGYNGLVITDALNMGALTKNYTDEEIYTKTINAGTDLLLMPNGSKKTIEYIKKNISEERINKSVEKILKFKYTYLTNYETLDKSYLNSQEHQAVINKINN
jgi:beta-N-acetylhexosaminidase